MNSRSTKARSHEVTKTAGGAARSSAPVPRCDGAAFPRLVEQARPAVGPDASSDAAADALLDVLAELYGALKRLAGLAGEKLEALRRADAEVLQRVARQEHETLERIAALEPRRSAALARLAQTLQLGSQVEPTLSQLAEAAPQPLRSRLAARAAGLRDVATVLRDRNAQAARVARDLYTHVRGVLHEVARGCQETVGYGPGGPRQRQSQNWIDAVG